MLRKLTILLSVIICSSVNAPPSPTEFLKKFQEEIKKRELVEKASYAADVGFNGVKGFGFGLFAGGSTVGYYTSYAIGRAAKLFDQKALLETSDAEQFGSKSRQELKKETATREIANRVGKVIGSSVAAYVLLAITIIASQGNSES